MKNEWIVYSQHRINGPAIVCLAFPIFFTWYKTNERVSERESNNYNSSPSQIFRWTDRNVKQLFKRNLMDIGWWYWHGCLLCFIFFFLCFYFYFLDFERKGQLNRFDVLCSLLPRHNKKKSHMQIVVLNKINNIYIFYMWMYMPHER